MRQNQTPVSFPRKARKDRVVAMTSGRAGKVVPLTFIPLLNGDSASGRVAVDIELAEMPRPLLNAVMGNVQAWVVPKCAHPQFAGFDDYMHARQGTVIKTLGDADRDPPAFFTTLTGADVATAASSDLFETLGLHVPSDADINVDLIDAFSLVYNFRLAAHSTKLSRRQYASEDLSASTALPRAFWPKAAMSNVVPDYESALILGELQLDIAAGQLPVSGIGFRGPKWQDTTVEYITTDPDSPIEIGDPIHAGSNTGALTVAFKGDTVPEIFAEMGGQSIPTTLAGIDKARTTKAFAELRQSYAGNDATGFDNDDTLVAMLMSGLRVPDEYFKRPILLDSAIVPFGFTERFATDAANLDDSVSQGRASATLSLNVPAMPCEAMIIVTVEVLPELLQEAQSDEYLMATEVAHLPDALRDVQRELPVDVVLNRRRDARHTTPGGGYGFEPMNDKWNRSFTRLGGVFKQDDPSNPFSEQRAAIWLPGIVDPAFTEDHWLAPDDFPHNVFSDNLADAFEAVVRHDVTISGITQIGDTLEEDNNNFNVVKGEEE